MEKTESIKLKEEEISKREDKIRRWEREMQRLESKTVMEAEKNLTTQSEFERMRSMRVDDAILIERLKSEKCEV